MVLPESPSQKVFLPHNRYTSHSKVLVANIALTDPLSSFLKGRLSAFLECPALQPLGNPLSHHSFLVSEVYVALLHLSLHLAVPREARLDHDKGRPWRDMPMQGDSLFCTPSQGSPGTSPPVLLAPGPALMATVMLWRAGISTFAPRTVSVSPG